MSNDAKRWYDGIVLFESEIASAIENKTITYSKYPPQLRDGDMRIKDWLRLMSDKRKAENNAKRFPLLGCI